MVTKSEKYADYIKDHLNHLTADQTFYAFPNGYGAIVIFGIHTYGFKVALIKWDKEDGTWDKDDGTWGIDYTTPITDDVVGHIEDLDLVLGEIYDLPKDLELEEEE